MTLSKMLWGMGLVAAGAVGAANAQGPKPTYVQPYSPAPIAPADPNCVKPGVPATLPGTVIPGTPALPGSPWAPSTPSIPSIPGTTPSLPSSPGIPSTPSIPSTPGSPSAPSVPSAPSSPAGTSGAAPSAAGSAAGAAAAASTVGGGGGEGGSSGGGTSAPNMIGDLGIKGFYRDALLSNASGGPKVSPIVSNGQFRIIENESPVPRDRVFVTFNYFNDVGGDVPNVNSFDLYRTTVGFEKTFLAGDASFGARLPILYRDTGLGKSIDGFADLTLITKYAFINDREGGNVVSAGLAVTVPLRDLTAFATADRIPGQTRDINDVLLQPYVGFLASSERFYVQGFSSYVQPLNSTDTRFISNDIGVGYKAYQNAGGEGLTAVIPTIEAHLVNPLNNRSTANAVNGGAIVGFTDQLVITGGVHFGLNNRTWVTFAYGTPVTGPNLFDYEATVQLNCAF